MLGDRTGHDESQVSYPSLVESHKSWLGSSTSLRSRSSGKISNTTIPGVFTDGARIVSLSVLWELPSPLALEDEAMSSLVCCGHRQACSIPLVRKGASSFVPIDGKGGGDSGSLAQETLGITKTAGLKDIYGLREPYELEAAVPQQSAVG